MTLDLTARYPSQVITTDPEYPLGKARNRTAPGDGTGTPFEQDLVNDWLGATQALLDAGGITASGDPDKVGVSDVVDAVRALATRPAATYALNAGSAIPCTMTQISASPGFTLITGTQIEVPERWQVSRELGSRDGNYQHGKQAVPRHRPRSERYKASTSLRRSVVYRAD